jgi:hypothetical protein
LKRPPRGGVRLFRAQARRRVLVRARNVPVADQHEVEAVGLQRPRLATQPLDETLLELVPVAVRPAVLGVPVRPTRAVDRINVGDGHAQRGQARDDHAPLGVPREPQWRGVEVGAQPGRYAVRATAAEAAIVRIMVKRGVATEAGQGGVHARNQRLVLGPDAHFLQAQHLGRAQPRMQGGQAGGIVLQPVRQVLDIPRDDAHPLQAGGASWSGGCLPPQVFPAQAAEAGAAGSL